MSASCSDGSTTLPRDFKLRYERGPTTPEPPPSHEELRQPSPPRPRLKIRARRKLSLQPPTEQFLASVAAADVPIPTIEVADEENQDISMFDQTSESDSGYLAPQRHFSPPKTPVPQILAEDSPSQRPQWRMRTPAPGEDYHIHGRSFSAASDGSDDSFCSGSGSRFSHHSEDGSCTSPESDAADPFPFPTTATGKFSMYPVTQPAPALNAHLRSKRSTHAPWTKLQSMHLWATYMIYLSDPTVTPFRIGASCVPPEGVCHRVARQARRSWKGGKTPSVPRTPQLKSGSNTPTAEPSNVFAAWPHSSSSTRNHLRDLCRKQQDTSSVSRYRHLQSRSPTPFTKPGAFSQREPERLATFETQDIALSLATSTAASMQPDGPLAKMTRDSSAETSRPLSAASEGLKPFNFAGPESAAFESRGRRLDSPFTARTYGPSSSKSYERRPSPPRHALSGPQPHLGSPLHFSQPSSFRSLNNKQKRRAQHDLEEELSPSGAIVRPSILDEQLFSGGMTTPNQRRVRSRGFSLGDEALRSRVPGIFQPSIFTLASPPQFGISESSQRNGTTAAPTLLPSATFDLPPAPAMPPRLGSPFSESGPSNNTFPRRLFIDPAATIKRSTFATMHQTRRSIESFDFGQRPSLQSRLAGIDERLRDIREREASSGL